MRTALLLILVCSLAACAPRPVADPDALNVTVELARTDEGYQPPVFLWNAPIAARLTVARGGTVVWEVAEGDRQGPDGVPRRGPLTPPLSYGSTFSPGETEATPRVLVQPTSLQPGVLYNVTVVGYDGATSTTTFSVQVPFAF